MDTVITRSAEIVRLEVEIVIRRSEENIQLQVDVTFKGSAEQNLQLQVDIVIHRLEEECFELQVDINCGQIFFFLVTETIKEEKKVKVHTKSESE